MFLLQILGWFMVSCVLMSFIEHQVHSRLMHRQNFFSRRTAGFQRMFEAHAIVHHQQHLTLRKAPIKAIPFAAVIALVSWQGAAVFVAVMWLHHWLWNKIHLEMHKPEQRLFSTWPIYKFLARYHWLHHRYRDKNFNVVFPLADYILGTSARVSAVDLQSMEQSGLC